MEKNKNSVHKKNWNILAIFGRNMQQNFIIFGVNLNLRVECILNFWGFEIFWCL
jgi:hypothetical protein